MYERNAIVLERYFEKKFGFDKPNNLKITYTNFSDLLEELEKYQIAVLEEENIIKEFDEIAVKIQNVQKTQEKLCATNEKLEEERNRLFNILDENPSNIENKLEKIENSLEKNNKELKNLRIEFIENLKIFEEKQSKRNSCAKERRIAEKNHVTYLQKITNIFQQINLDDIKNAKDFLNTDKETVEYEIFQILIKNGKSERVEFYVDAMQKASKVRIEIAQKEIECYVTIYDKLKKILQEIEEDNWKLAKYQKALRDTDVKLAFLKAEKEYIVGFLDNERMIAINGSKVHQKIMKEACSNFDADMEQITNLYELILREVSGKSTKKAYKELYNKTYLKEIEDKEKNFEQEVHHIKISMGTVINSNYWRIEGIKNIYNVFQEEVSEKFEKDLSEFKIEEPEIIEEFATVNVTNKQENKKFNKTSKDINSKENYNNNDYFDEDDEWDDEEDGENEIEGWEDFDDEDNDIEEMEDIEEYEEDNEDNEDDEWDDEDDEWDDEEDEWDDEDDEWDDEEDDIENVWNENKENTTNKRKDNTEEEETESSKGIFNKFFKNKKK